MGFRQLDTAVALKDRFLEQLATVDFGEWPHAIQSFTETLSRVDLHIQQRLTIILEFMRAADKLAVLRGSHPDYHADIDCSAAEIETALVSGATAHDISSLLVASLAGYGVESGQGHKYSPLTIHVLKFINERYAEPIGLRECAATVARQKQYVATVFKRDTGETVSRYLNRLRVAHAIEQIELGEKIEAVRMLVGFRSRRSFYLHFHKFTGTVPGSFKPS